MNSNCDRLSKSSGGKDGRYLHSDAGGIAPAAVAQLAPGYGVLTSNAEEKCCISDYFEVMSPGLENWRIEKGKAPASTTISNEVGAEIPSSNSHLVDLYALPYKKRPYTFVNDSVSFASTVSTLAIPNKGSSSASSSEVNKKQINAFKHLLVDRVKILLDPDWRNGRLSKEEFKEIVMKTTNKVFQSIPKEKIPDTHQKIEKYLDISEKRIFNVVQQYLKNLQLHKAKASKS